MSFNDPACSCEATSHSQLGPVADTETLARLVIAPMHINQRNGLPSPAAFQVTDLMERGLSVLRRDHTDDEELRRQGTKLCKNKPDRSLECVMLGSADEIRQLLDRQGQRAFCLVDDEVEDQPTHAIIMRSSDQDNLEMKELRGRLMKIFATVIRP